MENYIAQKLIAFATILALPFVLGAFCARLGFSQ
jgi:hypothetical protein